MTAFDDEQTRLLLVGELPATMALAAEMIQGSDGSVAVGTADCGSLNSWCRSLGKLAVVNVSLDLGAVVSRLRGEAAPATDSSAAIEQLVGQSVNQVERALILQTLDRCGGNRTTAAAILGISVRTMRNKLRSFQADDFVDTPTLCHQ